LKILLYFLLITLSLPLSTKVQDSTSTLESQELIYDVDSTKEIKKFSLDKIEEFRSDTDFNYTEYQETDNMWTQFKNWANQLWSKFIHWLFGVEKVTGFWAVLLRLLPYLIIISVLFLLGWLFMKVNPRDMLFEKQEAPQIMLSEDEDIIQNQDIQELIELIDWESQKTNTDYIKEIRDDTIKSKFQNITRLYDFIWYGSFEVDEKSFQKAQQKFTSITNTINS